MKALVAEDIGAAVKRIAPVVRRTAVQCLDPRSGWWVKREDSQVTGSFKVRGAANFLLGAGESLGGGVVVHSSGNFGIAAAYLAVQLGLHAVVVLPDSVPQAKRDAVADLDAEIVLVPASERALRARQIALERGFGLMQTGPEVIAGHATLAREILGDLPQVDCIVLPIGSGGLACGVARVLAESAPEVRLLGVEPEFADETRESLRRGQLVQLDAAHTGRTAADGLRVQITEAVFQQLREYPIEVLTVSEEQIRIAQQELRSHGIRAEPSGAVAAAGYLAHHDQLSEEGLKNIVTIVTGSDLFGLAVD